MIYEDHTNRNISTDMENMNISFISRVFASGVLRFQDYKKVQGLSFVEALELMDGFKDSEELAQFTYDITTYFLQALPKVAPQEGETPQESKKKVKKTS